MERDVIAPGCPAGDGDAPVSEAAPDAHAHFTAQKRFGSLDGLRALSIIAVIWHHTAPSGTAHALAEAGANGVTLFFAISGFLITTLMLRERQRTGGIDLPAFYMRRSLRIFPLYYATLLAYVLIVYALERHSDVGRAFFNNLPYFATYTSNIFVPLDGRVIFYFSWSLAAEEQFYLLWPLILTRLRSDRQAALLLIGVIVLCSIGHLLHNRFLSAVPIAILGGALLAMALNQPSGFRRLYAVLARPWSTAVVVFLFGFSLATNQPYGFINAFLCVALVGCCVIREQHPLTGFLNLPTLVYMGSISYGMYLLHMLSKNLAVMGLRHLHLPVDGLHVFILTLLISTVVAGLVFRYYESIFLGIKVRYAR